MFFEPKLLVGKKRTLLSSFYSLFPILSTVVPIALFLILLLTKYHKQTWYRNYS